VTWTQDDWEKAVASPDWGQRVARALEDYFSRGKPLDFYQATLIGVTTENDQDGVAVLRAIYDHPLYKPRRTGYRRRLDRCPFSSNGEDTPEASLAAEIALYDISEPMGRYYDLLVKDENDVWWWGDGYPPLSSHPEVPS